MKNDLVDNAVDMCVQIIEDLANNGKVNNRTYTAHSSELAMSVRQRLVAIIDKDMWLRSLPLLVSKRNNEITFQYIKDQTHTRPVEESIDG